VVHNVGKFCSCSGREGYSLFGGGGGGTWTRIKQKGGVLGREQVTRVTRLGYEIHPKCGVFQRA
jgi:hypothetical protein